MLHPPPVVDSARQVLREYDESNLLLEFGRRVFLSAGRKRGVFKPDTATIDQLPPDISASMEPHELIDLVARDRQQLQAMFADHDCRQLSLAVHRVSASSEQRVIGQKEISNELRQIFGSERATVREIIEPWQGIVTVTRNYELDPMQRPNRLLDMQVDAQRSGRNIQAWVPETTEWHEPMHSLCATIQEIETLLALKEWVAARKLPYLPVMAPLAFETGKLADISDKNMRADVLLCGLLPPRNEIIPIQAKHNRTQVARQSYGSGIVMVSARDLGMELSDHYPVKVDGNSKTGLQVITTYGSILNGYLAARRVSTHGRTPSKKILKEFQSTLKPAFDFFDSEITPHIDAYPEAPESSAQPA